MALKHSVYDTDAHFKIDAVTRQIKNDSSGKTVLIQGDHNSERFTFEVPRLVDGHDLSLCDVVQVHYINIDSTNKNNVSKDLREVDDLQISPDSDDVVILSWLIDGKATRYAGTLHFAVKFKCTDGAVKVYEWNTMTYTGISISSGIDNGEAIVEDYSDVLEQWRAELFGGSGNGGNVDLSGYVKTVNGTAPDENGNVEIAIPDSGQNPDGLPPELKTALVNYFTHVMPQFDDANGLSYVNAILTALGAETRGESGDTGDEEAPDTPVTPEKTLSSISAAYSGGDVAVGTAVTDLTGIVVTAHYSDGTSETVTGYTLNGTIAEGSNTITVTYQGKTATFTVTGVAEEADGVAVAISSTDQYSQKVHKYGDSSIRDAVVADVTDVYTSYGGKFAWYTDSGLTAYSGNMTSRSGIKLYTSEVFDVETAVKICIEGSDATYDLFVVGATEWDGLSTPNSHAIHNCQSIGTETNSAGNVYHELSYTVPAGKRIVVASYVKEVRISIISPDATPEQYTVNMGTSVAMLASTEAFEQDTLVRVRISASSQTYTSFWLASTDIGDDSIPVCHRLYNIQKVGKGAWESSVDLEVEYTVLAGCRLALASYTTAWSYVTVSVTEVV